MYQLINVPIINLIEEHPYITDFLTQLGIKDYDKKLSITELINSFSDEFLEEHAIDKGNFLSNFDIFIERMKQFKEKSQSVLNSITIIGGKDKSGKVENLTLTMKRGEIICIVGPTGSGKSRLLGDIECLAQGDTPTTRRILINNCIPSNEKRFSMQNKLVAQLSQNMNFVMDLSVGEFISMHAESRMIKKIENMVTSILSCANDLAGEPFTKDTPVTQLSGGQSRSLMIADTALLSSSPIVLIDEIENAGVDRKKALELLVKEEKIVLLSTHDPILALMGDKRLVIKNGGIDKIIETSAKEKSNLEALQKFDSKMFNLRNKLRLGSTIDFDISKYFLT